MVTTSSAASARALLFERMASPILLMFMIPLKISRLPAATRVSSGLEQLQPLDNIDSHLLAVDLQHLLIPFSRVHGG